MLSPPISSHCPLLLLPPPPPRHLAAHVGQHTRCQHARALLGRYVRPEDIPVLHKTCLAEIGLERGDLLLIVPLDEGVVELEDFLSSSSSSRDGSTPRTRKLSSRTAQIRRPLHPTRPPNRGSKPTSRAYICIARRAVKEAGSSSRRKPAASKTLRKESITPAPGNKPNHPRSQLEQSLSAAHPCRRRSIVVSVAGWCRRSIVVVGLLPWSLLIVYPTSLSSTTQLRNGVSRWPSSHFRLRVVDGMASCQSRWRHR